MQDGIYTRTHITTTGGYGGPPLHSNHPPPEGNHGPFPNTPCIRTHTTPITTGGHERAMHASPVGWMVIKVQLRHFRVGADLCVRPSGRLPSGRNCIIPL